MIDEKCFFSVKEFAKLLSISEQGIRKLLKTGDIKSIRLTDAKKAKLRIPRSELLRLQAEAYGTTDE
jgi:excisionase family DNA binding protein